ncbi:MAG TPA: hypothetical protein VK912_14305 [Longimicrobiales bacterium]|nr:hypothetical protein [Longimicrobiales bacterium]
MMRRLFSVAILALTASLAACESDPLALDTAESVGDDELAAVLVAESGSSDLRGARDGADRSNSLFERLAAQIPGFGGLYRIAPCVVAVVLTADADVEQAVRIVHAAVEPLVVRRCPTDVRVEPVRGQYTFIELRRLLLASRPLNTIEGVGGARIDFRHNRLVIYVSSRQVARVVLHALPRVGIPADAVLFQRDRKLERPESVATAMH